MQIHPKLNFLLILVFYNKFKFENDYPHEINQIINSFESNFPETLLISYLLLDPLKVALWTKILCFNPTVSTLMLYTVSHKWMKEKIIKLD